jgi:hypothetical protein
VRSDQNDGHCSLEQQIVNIRLHDAHGEGDMGGLAEEFYGVGQSSEADKVSFLPEDQLQM